MISGIIFPVFLFMFTVLVIDSQTYDDEFGYFWHLTDPHVNISYSAPDCIGNLGSYKCDSPLALWMSALNSTIQFQPTLPDFVIFSGDSVSHGVSPESFLPSMRAVSKSLQEMFPPDSVPVIPVLGNHDVHPDNFMNVSQSLASKQDSWCHLLATDPELWMNWVHPEKGDSNNTSNSYNFAHGCFYSKKLDIKTGKGRLLTRTLRIVSLNGLLWYRWNPGANQSIPDPLGQFAWLSSILNYARKNEESVLLTMHFPLGATENSPEKFQHLFDIYNEKLVDLLTTYSDVLVAGLFAHQHTDSFRVLRENSNPVLSLFLLPSISPMRLNGLGYFNPRIRLFKFMRSNLKIINYHQYFLNLSDPYPIWARDYSAADEYNLADLSPVSLSGLLQNFLREESNWSKYWSHELGGPSHESGSCPGINSFQRCTHLCAMNYLSLPSLRKCITACESNTSLYSIFHHQSVSAQTVGDSLGTLPIVIIVILAFVLILLGIVFCVNRELCRRSLSTRPDHEILDCHKKFSAISNKYANFLESTNPGTTSLHSRNSSLDGTVDLNATGDERSLIASKRELPSASGLGRLSGLVKFSRCNNDYDATPVNDVFFYALPSRKMLASHKFSSHGGLPLPLSTNYPNGSNEELSSSIQLSSSGVRNTKIDSLLVDDINYRGTMDFESEERAYDAEVEDDDDEDYIHLPSLKKGIPFKNFMSGLPSKLNNRCLLNASRNRRSDNQLDASDNEYYSIHSSLQCLHPVVNKDDYQSTEYSLPNKAMSMLSHSTGEILNGSDTSSHSKFSSDSDTKPSANNSSHTSIPTPTSTTPLNKSNNCDFSVRHSGFLDTTVVGI